MSAKGSSLKTIFFALGANGAIALSKFVAAFLTGSGSMLAEAIHSSADCGNQLLLLWGLQRSKRPPTPEFPLGYGKETYFWSFIVALMLFSLGGVFSLHEGWEKLHHAEPLHYPWLAVAVLGFGVIAESFSMWACIKELNKTRGQRNLWQWFKQSREAELIVVFGEDFAALLGLTVALLAVVATWITGNPLYDALGSMVIGVLLVLVALFVANEIKSLLVGEGADPDVIAEMRAFLQAEPAVAQLYNLLTLQLGADVMVAVKAKIARQGSEQALVQAINRIEADFRIRFPQVMWLFFEPDDKD